VQRAVVAGIAVALAASGAAYGFWSSAGAGTGTSRTPTVSAITLSAGTPVSRLYPGGTSDVAVSMTNPNTFPVRVSSIALDSSLGTGGFSVDASHSGCGLSVLSFAAQSNGGDGWTIPASGSLSVDLTGSLSMTLAAANACQGATFTVYLNANHDLFTAIKGTTGLVSYWRLGSNPLAADNFTGTAATTLTSHTGTVATPWSTPAGTDPVLSDANRLRRTAAGWALSYSSITMTSADYSVQADLVVKSLVAGDALGVAGRLDPATTSYYSARYRTSDNTWRIFKTVGGTDTSLSSAAATLTPGTTYRVRLDLVGSALTLSVNGVSTVTATDSSITAKGYAGLQLGTSGTSATVTDTTGLHADNFRAYPNTGSTAPDSLGSNTGAFLGTVGQNEPGAVAGDLNGAATLDGSTGAMKVTGPTGLPVGAAARSVELWFKRTSTADQTLFSYGSQSANALLAARLTTATNLRLATFSVNRDFTLPATTSDGAWHHLVVTYDGVVLAAYLDGTGISGQGTTLATALDSTGFVVGASLATGSNYFAGSIDEVAVYNVVLTAATVKDHYRVGAGS
jgi:hypothetical protein